MAVPSCRRASSPSVDRRDAIGVGQHISSAQVVEVIGRRSDTHAFWMMEAVTTGIVQLLGEMVHR